MKNQSFALLAVSILSFGSVARAADSVDCGHDSVSGKQVCFANTIVSVPTNGKYAQVDSPECESDAALERAEWLKVAAKVAAAVPAARQYVGAVVAVGEFVRSTCQNGCEGDLGRIAEILQLHKSTSSCRVISLQIPESDDFQRAYVMARVIGGPWTGCGPGNQTLGGSCGCEYAAAETAEITGVGSGTSRVKVITAVIKNWRNDAPIEARLTVVYIPAPAR